MKIAKKVSALLLAVLLCMLVSCDIANRDKNETFNTDADQSETFNQLPESKLAPFEIPVGGYDGSEVGITFYHTMNDAAEDVLDKQIAKFNSLYPGIHIEAIKSDSDYTIYNMVGNPSSSEKAPNIVCCNSDIAALYADAKYAVGLDALAESQITVTDAANNKTVLGLTNDQKSDFIEAFYIEGSQFEDGCRYTLPFSKSTEVLYYNKTFFDEKSISEPKTWDDILMIHPIVQSNYLNGFTYAYSSGADLFITMCAQRGSEYTSATGDHFLYNNEANCDIVDDIVGFHTIYELSPSDAYGADISTLFKNTDPSEKNCYSVSASSADALHYLPEKVDGVYPFEVGIAPMPQGDLENPKVLTHGSNVCIFNDENPQKVVASWLFLKYLTTNAELQAELSMASGNMPVIKSAIETPAYQDFLSKADGGDHIVALAIKASLAQADAFFAPPAFVGSYQAYEQIGKLMTDCVLDCIEDPSRDPKEVIKKAFEDSVKKCEKYVKNKA